MTQTRTLHVLNQAQLAEIAKLFASLSEPNRLRILQVLGDQSLTVSQVLEATGLKQANASKQLASLYSAGLLERIPEGTTVRYRIKDPMIFDLCSLVCAKLARDAQNEAKSWKGMG